MARRSPAVHRVALVLDHLATAPQTRFSLSDLTRDLDLSNSTAHALLATMLEVGYLVRHEDKTYSLGPALIALGNAAESSYPAAALARGPMQRLSDELDLQCVASAAIGDEIVILAATGTPQPLRIDVRPGVRLPLVPPLGTIFIAWSGRAVIDGWLDRLGPGATDEDLRRYRNALDVVRQRMFSVGLGGDDQEDLVAQVSRGRARGSAPVRGDEYALLELSGTTRYSLSHIGAPVFGPDGRVALGLFLVGFQGEFAADEVPTFAERVLDEAMSITSALGGVVPPT